MKKEIKEKWLDALRSGEYKQGTNKLRNINNGFCCLGVLCDIYIKETNNASWREDDGQVGKNNYLLVDTKNVIIGSVYLPDPIIEWSGLKSSDPRIKAKNNENLSVINDKGTTFEEIADIIEKEI